MYIKEDALRLLTQISFLHKFSLMSIFYIVEKDSDSTEQSSRLSKEKVKKQLIDSLVCNENISTKDLNEQANKVEGYDEAMNIIKEYEDIIKTKKKNIIFFAYKQGKNFRKFKENRELQSLVERFKITKGTIIFKINIVKLIDKYPQMMTSTKTLNFLKSYYKDIKNICKENQEDFRKAGVI